MLYFFLMLLGAAVGACAAFPERFLHLCSALQNLCLLAVVFCIGLSLGRDPQFVHELLSLGAAGLALAFFSLGGSVLAVFVLKKLLGRKGGGAK